MDHVAAAALSASMSAKGARTSTSVHHVVACCLLLVAVAVGWFVLLFLVWLLFGASWGA